MGFAIQPGQNGAVVVEMTSYEDDGMVGMMMGEKSGGECDCIIIGKMIVVGNINCFHTAHDQNIPYMAGGGRGGGSGEL